MPPTAHALALKHFPLRSGRPSSNRFLVDLYREDAITHGQLSRALGLDSYDSDGVLKKHGAYLEISVEELRAEAAALRDVSPE
jgi:predicted HTH domain antitoxin